MSKGPEYLGSVSLIITGRELDPKVVTQVLQMKPDHAWRRGDMVGSARAPSVAKEGGWKRLAARQRRSPYLEPQLQAWSTALRPKVSGLRRLKARGLSCRLSIFAVAKETVSVVVPVELQRSLAALGLTWELSVQLGVDDAAQHLAGADA
jgi:hypothetical protein